MVAVLLCLVALTVPQTGFAHGSFHGRIERVNAQIDARPRDPELYLERSRILRAHGDFDESLADIERAAELNPELEAVLYDRGLTLLAAGRAAEAEAALGLFLDDAPEHADAHAARARARMELGRPLAAARDFDVAIDHQPVPIPERYLDRSRALAAAGDEHFTEAIAGLDAGLATLGPVAALELAAVDLEVRSGDFDAALLRVERAASGAARKETWLARRGDIELRAGRDAKARSSYEKALAEIERLPTHRRRTPRIQQLEAKLRSEIERLEATPEQ